MFWSRLSDLNRGPTLYKSVALPTELRRRDCFLMAVFLCYHNSLFFCIFPDRSDIVEEMRDLSAQAQVVIMLAFYEIDQMSQSLIYLVLKIDKNPADLQKHEVGYDAKIPLSALLGKAVYIIQTPSQEHFAPLSGVRPKKKDSGTALEKLQADDGC